MKLRRIPWLLCSALPLFGCSSEEADDDDDGTSGQTTTTSTTAPCSIELSGDPAALVRALVVEGGVLVEAPPPEPYTGYPIVDNGGCDTVAVDRGESFIVPFEHLDSREPVWGCAVTVEGAGNHIEIAGGPCDGGMSLVGDLPLTITVPGEACAGTFTLAYAAVGLTTEVSEYLTTAVQVSPDPSAGGPAQTCPTGP